MQCIINFLYFDRNLQCAAFFVFSCRIFAATANFFSVKEIILSVICISDDLYYICNFVPEIITSLKECIVKVVWI